MKKQATELTLQGRINDGLSRYWKMGLIALGVIIVIMAGFLIWESMNRTRQVDSSMLAEDIQKAYQDWVRDTPETRDSEELESLIAQALEEYPRFFAAQRALFTQGLVSLENQEWAAAAESFLNLADNWSKSYLAPVSLFNAGSAEEQDGNIEMAKVHWNRLVEEYADVSPDAPETLFNLGRIFEAEGDTETAVSYYRDLAAQYPSSRWTNLSKSRILVLEGQL